MRVIRIERKEDDIDHWLGLYSAILDLVRNHGVMEWEEYKETFENDRHPSPMDDQMGYGWTKKAFGWQSYKRFSNWMTINMLDTLAIVEGFHVKVFDVDDEYVVTGNSQCAFDIKKAKCVFSEEITVEYPNLLQELKVLVENEQ